MSYMIRENFNQIGKNLYLGDYFSSLNYRALLEFNITHILVCGNELCCRYPESFTYKHLSIMDTEDANLIEFLDEAHRFIQAGVKRGKVLVHCAEAKSRSVSIIISYFMKVNEINYEKAFGMIKKIHPIANPNPGFKKQLKNYEKEILRNNSCINSIF